MEWDLEYCSEHAGKMGENGKHFAIDACGWLAFAQCIIEGNWAKVPTQQSPGDVGECAWHGAKVEKKCNSVK